MNAIIEKGKLIINDKTEFFEYLIHSAGALIHIIAVDEVGNTLPVWTNEQYHVTTGYTLEERQAIGFTLNDKDFYHSDDVDLIRNATCKARRERDTFHSINFRVKGKYGDWKWLTVSAKAITINNNPNYLLIVAIPIDKVAIEYQILIDRYYKKILQLRNKIKLDKLSKTEKEIVAYLAKGLNPKQIAKKRNRSYDTIINHKRNIFKKLDINRVSDLISFAIKNGLD